MAETLVAEHGEDPRDVGGARRSMDHFQTFRVTYLSVFSFMLLYIVSVEVAETLLQAYFYDEIRQAVSVSPVDGPVGAQIDNRVSELLDNSPWIHMGGVRVNVTVLGADGQTPLYVPGGAVVHPPPAPTLEHSVRDALKLLPAISDVFVSVSHGSLLSTGIFVLYAAILLQGLFLYNRSQTRKQQERLSSAVQARDSVAERAASIERELGAVRSRLSQVEPADSAKAEEIRSLENERVKLRDKLRELAEREAQLRASAARASELEQERSALEDLLDEAMDDLGSKEEEIQGLQSRLQTAGGGKKSAKGRTRENERLARRLRTLYKNVDFDDRAITDISILGDESLKLRAEEAIKRLADDPETAAVRRKVGGLPPQLSIYELGFAGKGRVYYTRGDDGRFRILLVGGKATQKADLEYLSRL
ncbi:MAG: hypothetical protein ACQGVC_03455 [Myxococcota bacterium]